MALNRTEHNNTINISFLIYNPTHRRILQVKYEWMIAGYYRVEFNRKAATQGATSLYMQLRVKDLSKIPTWRLKWDSNRRPSARKATEPTTKPTTPLITTPASSY